MNGGIGYALYLFFELAEQGYFFAWHTDKVYQRIDVLYQDGRQIAYQAIFQVVVGAMASA